MSWDRVWAWLSDGAGTSKVAGTAGLVAGAAAWMRMQAQRRLSEAERLRTLEASMAARMEHLELSELGRERRIDELRTALRSAELRQWQCSTERARLEAEVTRLRAEVADLRKLLESHTGESPTRRSVAAVPDDDDDVPTQRLPMGRLPRPPRPPR